MKPIIGITVESKFEPENTRNRGMLSLGYNYAEEVAKAGGVPILIPPTADVEAVAEIIDGWLIPGGADIDASYWGEPNHEKAEPNDGSRVESELALWKQVSPDLPVLGICYGCQMINVALGGTLEQHVPDRVEHESHSGGTLQQYVLDPSSRAAQVLGTATPQGKSYHHQAVGRVAEGLRAVGHHEDGTIEVVEGTGKRWLVGVQWHPERTPEGDDTQNLLRSFIAAAAEFKAQRSR